MIYFKTWMISNHEPVCFQWFQCDVFQPKNYIYPMIEIIKREMDSLGCGEVPPKMFFVFYPKNCRDNGTSTMNDDVFPVRKRDFPMS